MYVPGQHIDYYMPSLSTYLRVGTYFNHSKTKVFLQPSHRTQSQFHGHFMGALALSPDWWRSPGGGKEEGCGSSHYLVCCSLCFPASWHLPLSAFILTFFVVDFTDFVHSKLSLLLPTPHSPFTVRCYWCSVASQRTARENCCGHSSVSTTDWSGSGWSFHVLCSQEGTLAHLQLSCA